MTEVRLVGHISVTDGKRQVRSMPFEVSLELPGIALESAATGPQEGLGAAPGVDPMPPETTEESGEIFAPEPPAEGSQAPRSDQVSEQARGDMLRLKGGGH